MIETILKNIVPFAKLVGIIYATLAGLWTYTKFIIERGIQPPVEFDISLDQKGFQNGKPILEVILHLKNLGMSPLVVQSLWVDVRYMLQSEEAEIVDDSEKKHLSGLVCFPYSVREQLSKSAIKAARYEAMKSWAKSNKKNSKNKKREPRGLPILPYKTFVQSGVEQKYTYVPDVKKNTSFVLIFAEFYYATKASIFQRVILLLARLSGLTNYTLRNVSKPHTCQRVFNIIPIKE